MSGPRRSLFRWENDLRSEIFTSDLNIVIRFHFNVSAGAAIFAGVKINDVICKTEEAFRRTIREYK